jgi:hypothetical protein
MSTELLFGLFLQSIALVLVLFRVRRRRLAYTGILFVFVSVIYHGLTEIAQIMFPDMNFYRTLVSQDKIDAWMLVISPAILIFAVTYSLRVRPVSDREMDQQSAMSMGLVNWHWGLLIVVGLQIGLVALQGSGALGYWGGLLSEMLPFFSVLVFLEFLHRMQGRYLILVLLFQAGLGVLSGARSAIVFTFVLLLIVFIRYGIRINWKKSFLPIAISGVVFAFAISAMRAEVGRYAFVSQTNDERVQSLLSGLESLMERGIQPVVFEDFVYRFDGNAFSGLIASAYQVGYTSAGWTPILNNFLLIVPSFLNPNKLDAGRLTLNEKDYLADYFGMPGRGLIDYIPTTWGILFGAFGIWGILVAGLVMGWLYAILDNWLLRSRSLFSVLCGIGLTHMVIWFEQGVRIYFVDFRSVLALFLVLVIFGAVGRVVGFRPILRKPTLKLPRYSKSSELD